VQRAREWLAGALLALGGVLCAVVVLEMGVRFLHLMPDRFWEPDPIVGVRLMAGHRGWWTQEDHEFLVPVQINQHGLRDVEHDYAKAPGVFRILLLGDSFVEAMHVPLDACVARRLEEQLNDAAAGQRVEVVSAGVSGFGTASELLYFAHEGKRYQPDLVVLAFYPGNDVKNNSPTLEDTLKPVYASDGRVERIVSEGVRENAGDARGWLARSAAYHYLRQLLLVRHPQLAQSLAQHGLLRAEAVRVARQQDGVPLDYGVYASVLRPEWEDAWTHTEQLLEQLRQTVADSGAQLLIAVLSTREQVYPQSWEEILAAHPRMQGQRWDLDAPQRRVEGWCAAHGVPCVALAPAFRAGAARGGDRLHYQHDGHWTIAGHRLAATVLQDYLQQRQLVPVQPEGVSHGIH
jgi:hypothetical protein